MAKLQKQKPQEDQDYSPKDRSHGQSFKSRKRQGKPFFGNSNKWTLEQNEKFLTFLIREASSFEDQKSRKQTKIFVRLSIEINTRSPDQCRSHHQKMMKHHNNIEGIIEYLNQKIKQSLQVSNRHKWSQSTQQKVDYQAHSNHQQKEVLMKEINQEDVNKAEQDLWVLINKQAWFQNEQNSKQNWFAF